MSPPPDGSPVRAPKWTEFAATLMVLSAAVLPFRYAVIYQDILPKNPPQRRWS